MPAPALSSHARTHLKALAHPLSPLVLIGAEGLSAGVTQAVSVALEDHELIKVRLTQGYDGDRHEAAEALAPEVGAAVVQVIGRTIVLYRRRCRDLPKRPRIELPA
ncbi:MAG: ribosome assembly RNA-binding protein YhbY [Nannocystaceae bacterium]